MFAKLDFPFFPWMNMALRSFLYIGLPNLHRSWDIDFSSLSIEDQYLVSYLDEHDSS